MSVNPTGTTDDDAVQFFDGCVGWWRSVQFSIVRTPGGAYTKLPACLPVMVLALPTWFLARPLHRARHRPRRGLCLSCGYDLTGNTSGRRPECGGSGLPPAPEVAIMETVGDFKKARFGRRCTRLT